MSTLEIESLIQETQCSLSVRSQGRSKAAEVAEKIVSLERMLERSVYSMVTWKQSVASAEAAVEG